MGPHRPPAAAPRPQFAHKAHTCPALGPSYAIALVRAGSAAAAACGHLSGCDEWRESEARGGRCARARESLGSAHLGAPRAGSLLGDEPLSQHISRRAARPPATLPAPDRKGAQAIKATVAWWSVAAICPWRRAEVALQHHSSTLSHSQGVHAAAPNFAHQLPRALAKRLAGVSALFISDTRCPWRVAGR